MGEGGCNRYRQPPRFPAVEAPFEPNRQNRKSDSGQLNVPDGSVFDLENDPAETSNVTPQHSDTVGRFEDFIDQIAAKLGNHEKCAALLHEITLKAGIRSGRNGGEQQCDEASERRQTRLFEKFVKQLLSFLGARRLKRLSRKSV